MKDKKEKSGEKRNVWKIVSVVFIVMFILILAWALVSLSSRPGFTTLTDEQITLAEDVVAEDLQVRGDSIDNYEVSVTNRVVGLIGDSHPRNGMHGMKPGTCPGMNGCSRRNVQVSLRGNASGHLYIVDMDSERVVMRSFTEWLDD